MSSPSSSSLPSSDSHDEESLMKRFKESNEFNDPTSSITNMVISSSPSSFPSTSPSPSPSSSTSPPPPTPFDLLDISLETLHEHLDPFSPSHYLSLTTLLRIIDNVLSYPTTEKYRSLPITHTPFRQKVSSLPQWDVFLYHCGWREMEVLKSDGKGNEILEKILYLDENNRDKEILWRARELLTSEIAEVEGIKEDYKKEKEKGNVQSEEKSSSSSSSSSSSASRPLTKEEKTALIEARLGRHPSSSSSSSPSSPQVLLPTAQRIQRAGRIRDFQSGKMLETNGWKQSSNLSLVNRNHQRQSGSANNKNNSIHTIHSNNLSSYSTPSTSSPSSSIYTLSSSKPRIMRIEDIDWTSELEEMGKRCVVLTNEFRATHHLSPLTWDDDLMNIAVPHSMAMCNQEVPLGHDGFSDRVKQYPFSFSAAGENVGYCAGYMDPSKTAVDGWINSPGHRANLLGNFSRCGIGVYKSREGAYYFTQLFARC